MTMARRGYLETVWLLFLGGIVWRYSLLGPLAANRYDWLGTEALHAGAALGLFWLASRMSRSTLAAASRPLMLVALGGLALMLAGGAHTANGATRWIRVGGTSLQPAEFVKVIVVIYLAGFLARHRDHLTDFRRGLLPAIALLGATFLLIVKQPDFGTAVLLFAVGMWMLLVGGASGRHLATLVGAALPAGLWLILKEPYRLERIRAWLAPGDDLQGVGYQVNQAKLAIQEGGTWGRGLMEGLVRHGYLPESTNDFTAAVWIEEFGLVGLVLLMGAWAWVITRLFRAAREAETRFDAFLAAGIGALLAGQILFNLGVITGLLPNKGIPLPLLSSGGSSLLSTACLLGLGWRIMRVHEDAAPASVPERREPTVWNGL